MRCLMNDNCCQQPGICPTERTCKPLKSSQQSWKRYTCECKPGYSGVDCNEPIRSCGGYLNGFRKSGKHIIVDSGNTIYEVYCHFDSDGAWTLVQSSDFQNHTSELSAFRKPLTEDYPVSENFLKWNGYRLSHARMTSINEDSDNIRFTCDFEDVENLDQTDYLQIPLDQLGNLRYVTTNNPDNDLTSYRGTINHKDLKGCEIKLHQNVEEGLHVHIEEEDNCAFEPQDELCDKFRYFSHFPKLECNEQTHRCSREHSSTSQLWFGKNL